MVSNAVEWLNNNMHRNYPISDNCIVKSTSGAYLPSSFLTDASILIADYVEAGAEARFFISSVVCSGDYLTVHISYQPDAANTTSFECAVSEQIPLSTRATANIDEERTFRLTATPDTIPAGYEGLLTLTGSLIVGTCIDIYGLGLYAFTFDTAALLSTCVFRMGSGVRSVTFVDASENSTTFTDDFTIRAGDGIEFEFDTAANIIEIRRTKTAEELAATVTDIESAVTAIYSAIGNPVRSINNALPDPDTGNITMTGADCTSVLAVTNGLTFKNPCAKPCCTGENSSEVTAALQSLSDARDRLLQYYEGMSRNINEMQSRLASLIASRG